MFSEILNFISACRRLENSETQYCRLSRRENAIAALCNLGRYLVWQFRGYCNCFRRVFAYV